MYRNIESPYSITGTNIVFSVNYTSKTNKQLIEKRLELCLPEAGGGRKGNSTKALRRYKLPFIGQIRGYNVQHNKYIQHSYMKIKSKI